MTTLFAVAVVVFLYARNKERRLQGSRDNTFGYYLLSAFLDFLTAFLVAMVFYHVLLLVVLFSGWISTGTLEKLERALEEVRSYCAFFKISSPYALVVLLGVYWFGFATFAPTFKKYRKGAKRVYQIVAMLCCFTLLGTEVGPPALTLAVQIRKNRHEYGALRDNVRTAVGERVTELLVQRIANGFPASFPRDVNSVATFDKDLRGLRDSLDRIRRAGGSGKDVRSFLERHPPVDVVDKRPLLPLPRSEESDDADIKAEDVTKKSYEDIKASEELVQKAKGEKAQRDIGLQGRIDLTLELFKSVRENLKSTLLEEYIKEVPILGPIHDMLATTLDKLVEGFLNRKADALAASMPKDQGVLDARLSQAAMEISASAKVEVTSRLVARYRRPLAQWEIETRWVDSLKSRASQEIQIAEAPPRPRHVPADPAAQRELLPSPPKPSPRQDEDEALETFRHGLDSGWIVTRNSREDPSKIFVHGSSDPYYGLRDLKYLVREEPNGTWTVYGPPETLGGSEYGRRIGSMPRPPDVSVGECTCQ